MPGTVTTFHHCLDHLLERLRVRDLAYLDVGRADGARAISTFPGVSQFTVPYGDFAAAAVVVTIPVMILVLVFQRRIAAGVTAGAVKG
jgi:ABC-type glycerol-3-phosphate transport system permease component